MVARICATGNFTFGHELGHNMGLNMTEWMLLATACSRSHTGMWTFRSTLRDIMGVASLLSRLHSHTKFFQSKRYFQWSSDRRVTGVPGFGRCGGILKRHPVYRCQLAL